MTSSLRGMSTPRSLRRCPSTHSIGLCVAASVLLMLCLPGLASAEEQVVEFSGASFVLPDRWELEPPAEFEIANMSATVGVAASNDGRVSVYLIVIDPFGIDIEDWQLVDLLGPTIVDLLALNGADTTEVRIRRARCNFGGESRSARLVVFPAGSDDAPRLYAALGCGIEEPNRWAAAFVIVESLYDRPLLLRQEMLNASQILESFSFKQ